jgi:hypothetical protein
MRPEMEAEQYMNMAKVGKRIKRTTYMPEGNTVFCAVASPATAQQQPRNRH